MKFKVKVIPNAKKIKVSLFDNSIKVYLTAPAQDNKANEQLRKLNRVSTPKIKKRPVPLKWTLGEGFPTSLTEKNTKIS